MKWIEKLLSPFTLEKLLLPFTIVAVGTIGSIIISRSQIKSANLISISQIKSANLISISQIKSAETIAEAQIQSQDINVKSEHEIKVLDIFFNRITEGSADDREYVLNLMSTITPELAKRLIEAVINDKDQTDIHDVALKRLNEVDEIKEEEYYQSLSDSSRKKKVDLFKKAADTQFENKEFEQALGYYYEILKISPEDEYAEGKIKKIQDQIETEPNPKKTKPKKD